MRKPRRENIIRACGGIQERERRGKLAEDLGPVGDHQVYGDLPLPQPLTRNKTFCGRDLVMVFLQNRLQEASDKWVFYDHNIRLTRVFRHGYG